MGITVPQWIYDGAVIGFDDESDARKILDLASAHKAMIAGLWKRNDPEKQCRGVWFSSESEGDVRFYDVSGNALGWRNVVSGALSSDWSAQNGIASVIPSVLCLGDSGLPVSFSEIGGSSAGMTAELLVRWTELGCMFPVMLFSSRCLDAIGDSPQVMDILSYWSLVHRVLKPYLQLCEKEASSRGLAIVRSIKSIYPESWSEACTDEFMVGSELIAAPVLKRGAKGRSVMLPKGTWVNLFDSQEYSGGKIWFDSHWRKPCTAVFYNADSPLSSFFEKMSLGIRIV